VASTNDSVRLTLRSLDDRAGAIAQESALGLLDHVDPRERAILTRLAAGSSNHQAAGGRRAKRRR
jgi:DNA-binding NarL/FixJ family response regulator